MEEKIFKISEVIPEFLIDAEARDKKSSEEGFTVSLAGPGMRDLAKKLERYERELAIWGKVSAEANQKEGKCNRQSSV